MKQVCTLFLLTILIGSLYAQVPQAFSYQAVARDAAGVCIQNQEISIRISILDSIASGPALYTEFHTDTTNDQGLFSLDIGRGDVLAGIYDELADIPWSSNPKFLQVEMDPMGGNNYQLVGTSELLSVPYAMTATESRFLKSVVPITLSSSLSGSTIIATLEETWTWEKNGHTYALYSVPTQINWLTANDFCREANGHLITITNNAENQYLLLNVLAHPLAQGRMPLGLTDAIQENAFHWVTGEIGLDVTSGTRNVYRNWIANQPDNANNLEHFGEIREASNFPLRSWNDITASTEFYDVFIVEFSQGIISP